MDNRATLSDSNDFSGSSSICCVAASTESFSSPDVSALKRLSENLECVFESSEFDFFADAKIVVAGGREVPVHRCILAARSGFFKSVFAGTREEKEARFQLKELAKEVEVGYNPLVTVLGYLYGGRVWPLPKGVCACVDDDCSHSACRPAVDFMVEVLYTSFAFQISELVALYQRRLIEILDNVAPDDILLILWIAKLCGEACEGLLSRCINIVVQSDVDVVTLEKSLPHELVKRIVESRLALGFDQPESTSFPDKHVKRIHRALDSDDVELLRMLLKEGHTTLNDAHALHYAVAFGDAKTAIELLDLGLADVNHRNHRGYTVLHVAAMRKEPNILVSLLTKGARPTELTPDRRNALQIAKRLTRAVDYPKATEEGKPSPKDLLCIEVLEQAGRRDTLMGEASVSLSLVGDDLRANLLYLENRVGLAKLLFPEEAKVAMQIAQVNGTFEFTLTSIASRNLSDVQSTTVALNNAPYRIKEEHLNRHRALSKTVELGRCFFPRCSAVLDKIMGAEDLSDLAYLDNGTTEERVLKRKRYKELQEQLSKAFNEDKQEQDKDKSMISFSSSTASLRRTNGKNTCRR